MKFAYNSDKDEVIIKHENRMLERYLEIINDYSNMFAQYSCSLDVRCGWSNFLKNCNSEYRLPFQNGYSCYIYCNIVRNGEIIRYEDKDGEVDYYEASTSWSISFISRFFFHLNVTLFSDTDEIHEEMNRLLKIVESLQF